MPFYIFHLDGSSEVDPPLISLHSLFDELAGDGRTFDCVSVVHDSGWSLDLHRDGSLHWGHIRRHDSFHELNVRKQRVLALWRRLADGQVAWLQKQPWKKGDGFVPEPDQTLTGEQWVRARAVYRVIGRFLGMRYSAFELHHLRRGNVEEIVSHWERITAAFLNYTSKHSLTNHQEQTLLDDLRDVALNQARAVAAGHAYWLEIAADFQTARTLNLPPVKGERLSDWPDDPEKRDRQMKREGAELRRAYRKAKKDRRTDSPAS